MNETIKLILSLSLSASILAVVLYAFKPLIRNKLSKSFQYCLWIVILFRLVLPFSFEASVMNELFYGNQSTILSTSSTIKQPMSSTKDSSEPLNLPDINESTTDVVYNYNTGLGRHFLELFNRYSLYLWLIGALIMLTVNLVGYVRFIKHLKLINKAATDQELRMLSALLQGRNNVRLMRNHFVTTPMLIGILRPIIIIPDTDFNEKQLKNILLHELTHLKHSDIGVKWLTLIAISIHWFNPLMYFIRKEVHRACELACDEAVIKNLSPAEKQAYGDTLISVVADHKYPSGVLQATMCEEKKSLMERLLAIMRPHKTSKPSLILSIFLMGLVIFGALYLGAGVGSGKSTPPNLSGSREGNKTESALITTYDLAKISRHKTPYVGDNSKVGAIAASLPIPDNYFIQRYISMETSEKPYGLTIYYEAGADEKYKDEWPIIKPDSVIESNSRMNALVVFCMIDNLDQVTFAFRNSQSSGQLDTSRYNTSFTFQRASFEEKYGKLSELAENLDKLQNILVQDEHMTDGNTAIESPLPELTDAEVSTARKVVEEYFRAIAVKDDEAILATMYPRDGLTLGNVKSGNVQLYGKETRTLLAMNYDSQDQMRRRYRPSNHYIADKNIIVFKVSFNIDSPPNELGPWNKGIYDNWSMILIREDANSPWLIYDQGY
ncbi:M56 family metallopeptidase [Desulfosporosinus hippei]|uniref:Signal transducer regulating beta-lactamase production, contains metallopeptidase domain n=1 Tax=Desulfosporosinus hippei DSM 8344 TaxID=1121419 RepID=A0A1G8IDY6_9FIRM|nr:M56 family metallopeptidase [Desulfosporosinus hippei]SDI17103.1 Signal transducer regulating beta-lactamase production, contains metallopeptidase domain [Desulfosporosinus hippei DSM 8344]